MTTDDWIAQRIENQFVEQVNDLAKCVRERIWPSFDAAETEADAVRERVWDEAGRALGSIDDYQPDVDYESALEAGIDHFMRTQQLRQAYVNMTVVMLWHLYEQQLIVLVRRELPPSRYDDAPVNNPEKVAAQMFEERDILLSELPSSAKLDEVRCAANTIKHTDGSSATKLRKLRPALFNDPLLRPIETEVGADKTRREQWVPSTIDFTAFGDDLYMTLDIVDEYAAAVVSFWNDLAAKLREKRAPLGT